MIEEERLIRIQYDNIINNFIIHTVGLCNLNKWACHDCNIIIDLTELTLAFAHEHAFARVVLVQIPQHIIFRIIGKKYHFPSFCEGTADFLVTLRF